jgi:hypothetical protein
LVSGIGLVRARRSDLLGWVVPFSTPRYVSITVANRIEKWENGILKGCK